MSKTISLDRALSFTHLPARSITEIFCFILATGLGAYLRIPVPGSPIPITLQTFFVVLAGAFLGKKRGVFSQFGYILLGAAGYQLFQGSVSGPAYLAGPTGGYLMGFVIAAYLAGRLTETSGGGMIRTFAAFAFAHIAIYVSGAAWLICLYHIDLASAFAIGVIPFIAGDLLKCAVAAAIYSKLYPRMNVASSR